MVGSAPVWAAILASLGGLGLGTVLGALIQQRTQRRGQDLQRMSDRESETARRRSDALTFMRWAAELAVSSDPDKARLGAGVLFELQNSTLLLGEDLAMLGGMYAAAVAPSLRPGPTPSGSA